MHDHPYVQRTRRHQTHREDVMRAGKGMCHICGQGGADAIDHIVPVAWGGSDHPSNLAPAHTSCNSRKRDARPDAWTWRRPDMWIDGYGPHATMGMGPQPANNVPRGSLALWLLGLFVGFPIFKFGVDLDAQMAVLIGLVFMLNVPALLLSRAIRLLVWRVQFSRRLSNANRRLS
jgi:hypothetical protein